MILIPFVIAAVLITAAFIGYFWRVKDSKKADSSLRIIRAGEPKAQFFEP